MRATLCTPTPSLPPYSTLLMPALMKAGYFADNQHALARLPYVAQGAAQAIEDAGVLSLLLGRTSDIPTVLRLYTTTRKRRAELIQQSAVTTRQNLHLPDGKEQVERDRQFGRMTSLEAKTKDGREKITVNGDEESNPEMWADRAWQETMYGVDVSCSLRFY